MFNEPRKRFQEIYSASQYSLAGRYDNSICRTGPTDYKGWRNRYLGIGSWAPERGPSMTKLGMSFFT